MIKSLMIITMIILLHSDNVDADDDKIYLMTRSEFDSGHDDGTILLIIDKR